MTTITATLSQSIPASRCFVWFKQGWQLMRQAPFKIFLLLLFPLVMEGLFQLLPAPYGMVLSKWAMAIMVAAIWPILHHLATKQSFSLRAIKCKGWGKMLVLALLLLLPSVVQLWTAIALLGEDGIGLLLYAQLVEVSALQLGLIFASATPLILLLGFAPARLLLANDSLSSAIRLSIQVVVSAWRPMLLLALVHMSILLLVPFTLVLSALITGPWLACVSYQAYSDLFNQNKDRA